MARPYRLKKSRRLFHKANALYKKGWKKLSPADLQRVEHDLEALDGALLNRERERASESAKELERYTPKIFKKNPLLRIVEFVIAIALALAAAIAIRQVWFEPMEIPSGSMRPHFQELDRLIVTKTPFGLNIPTLPKHVFFNPDRVKRTGVFVFTSEDMDIPDQNTTYLGIPSKKRLIKRVMGKPGDRLYFYGGKIYGMDAEGRELTELRENKWAQEVTSVPFIHFQGKPLQTAQATTYRQMNEPLGRTLLASRQGQVFNGTRWVDERPGFNYSSFWGIGNYAQARLVTHEQAVRLGERPNQEAPLYLELAHHPTLTGGLQPATSLLPLSDKHLSRLMAHMTTSRFIVKSGKAHAEAYPHTPSHLRPLFQNVPDGRYQFTDGTLYKVAFSGILVEQPADHPLYANTPTHIQKLFNLGIEFNTLFQPSRFEAPYPNRYAFYRDGDLYILAHPILFKGDDALTAFEEAEKGRAGKNLLYRPFVDRGPPLKNGELDRELLQTFGLKIPDRGYLALGDNYANSGDSRQFGFVPQENIRGAPSFIFWPPGPRWGNPFMPPNPWITPARVLVCGVALVILICWVLWHRRRNRRSHFKRLSVNN